MKTERFIIKIIIFCAILCTTYLFALLQLSKGQVDYFYTKFTHKAESLIIGSSRVLYGISPTIIEHNFNQSEIGYPVLNYGFAREISDYGPIYLEAIKKKLDPDTKNGIFILEVNPGSLACPTNTPDTTSSLLKDPTFLSELKEFNRDPNLEYIRKVYTTSLYKGFNKSRRLDLIRYSHPNGWLEVLKQYEEYTVSLSEIDKWRKLNIESAALQMGGFKPSMARMKYLKETIDYLKNHGQVYIIRIPMYKGLLELERSFWPDFDTQINEIANGTDIPYFNYSTLGEDFPDFDGSHLFGESAESFSQKICNDIKTYQSTF